MARLFTNNASTLITNNAYPANTGILVTTGTGALFPSPVAPDYAVLTLTQPTTETSWEEVYLTSRTADSLVVVRGYEGSTALDWPIGSKLELRITADYLNSDVGFRGIPQVSKSLSYRAVASDAGKCIFHPYSDGLARTFEIPASSSVNYPLGTTLTFINQASAGTITLAIVAGTNSDYMVLAGAGTTGSRTIAPNGIVTAIKVAYNSWLLSGVGVT